LELKIWIIACFNVSGKGFLIYPQLIVPGGMITRGNRTDGKSKKKQYKVLHSSKNYIYLCNGLLYVVNGSINIRKDENNCQH
jgi:hypothetical protein